MNDLKLLAQKTTHDNTAQKTPKQTQRICRKGLQMKHCVLPSHCMRKFPSKQNSPPIQSCFEVRGFLPGRMKTFSTDNMAAMGSSISSQSREAAFMTAQDRLGGRGNCTRNSPSLVTRPLLIPGKRSKHQIQQK